jgi:hypothetical protein
VINPINFFTIGEMKRAALWEAVKSESEHSVKAKALISSRLIRDHVPAVSTFDL